MLISFNNFSKFSYHYKTSDDIFKASSDDIKDCLSRYVNKKVSFSISNYYGYSEEVFFWVNGFECIEKYSGCVEFNVGIVSNSDIPKRFYPSLLMIGKKIGLFAPISYRIEK